MLMQQMRRAERLWHAVRPTIGVSRHRLDIAAEADHIKAGRDISDSPGRGHHTTVAQVACRDVPHLAELEYTPLVESGRVPAMVTLTYPGDNECVATDGASAMRHTVLWRKRFQRERGEPARYIWTLEFQRRGARHIHVWTAPPHAVGRSGRPFREQLSQIWMEIVAHPDPEQRARHLLAGAAVDIRNGLRSCDPERLAIYFTKTHHRIN
jgi:hypothetical protein